MYIYIDYMHHIHLLKRMSSSGLLDYYTERIVSVASKHGVNLEGLAEMLRLLIPWPRY